jgi:hypothetical protein
MARFGLILLVFLYPFHARAQSSIPALDRNVTIDLTNESISSILSVIALQTGVKFAYSPTVIPAQQKASVHCTKKPVRVVLSLLFRDGINWKQKKDFIILTPRPIVRTREQKHVTISGYVYTAGGEQLSMASVVSERTRLAAVTNQYGYFSLNVLPNQLPLDVRIVKEHYPDTILHLTQENTLVNVSLPAVRDSNRTDTSLLRKSLTYTEKFFGQFFVNNETRSTMRNLRDTLFTKVQFSFIPYVSTNRLLAGNTINDVSINALAGYSQGVRVAEVGGLFNINRGDVQFFQAAGLCNLVSGNTSGAQLAGIANIDGGMGNGMRAAGLINIGHHMKGIQLAGWFNLNANVKEGLRHINRLTEDSASGIQVAGLANMNSGYFKGIRLAGLYNIGYTVEGIQLGGLFNTQIGSFHGVQVGGLFNTQIGTVDGIQVAGLFNATRSSSRGIQVAGLFNVNAAPAKHISIAGLANINTSETEGSQITSIVNYSRSVKGTQIALFNFSDTCEGTPIGLLNVARRGYHKIELFGDDVLYSQLAFRTGVLHLHTIFIAGVDMTRRMDALWSVGYGLGSYKRINEKWLMGADATAQLLIQHEAITNASGWMGTFFLAAERTFTPKFSIAFGPTFKLMSAGRSMSDLLVPYALYTSYTADNTHGLSIWAGVKISLRFL